MLPHERNGFGKIPVDWCGGRSWRECVCEAQTEPVAGRINVRVLAIDYVEEFHDKFDSRGLHRCAESDDRRNGMADSRTPKRVAD